MYVLRTVAPMTYLNAGLVYPPVQAATRFTADVRASHRGAQGRAMAETGRSPVGAGAGGAERSGRVWRVQFRDAEVACIGRCQEVVFRVVSLQHLVVSAGLLRDLERKRVLPCVDMYLHGIARVSDRRTNTRIKNEGSRAPMQLSWLARSLT